MSGSGRTVKRMQIKMDRDKKAKAAEFHTLKQKFLVRMIAKRMLETRHPCVALVLDADKEGGAVNRSLTDEFAEWDDGGAAEDTNSDSSS